MTSMTNKHYNDLYNALTNNKNKLKNNIDKKLLIEVASCKLHLHKTKYETRNYGFTAELAEQRSSSRITLTLTQLI